MIDLLRVTIIVPTYQDWDRLKYCIKALQLQSYPSELYEIIIVNNNTSDEVPELDLSENIQIISESRPGSYSARNAGLSVAKGDIIAFTDSDCIPDKDWLRNAIRKFQSDSGVERVTGPVSIFRVSGTSWLSWKFESITAFNQKYNVLNGVSVTANLFVKKSIFDQVGRFNASLLSGGDIEWNERATDANITLLFSKDVVVLHPARVSLSDLIIKYRRVTGGGFFRAKDKKKMLNFILWYFIPPLRFAKVLIVDGKSFLEVLLAVSIFWPIKLLMIFEIIRLSLGGKPVR